MECLTLDPRTADLARRIQAAALEVEQRVIDDETAVRYAEHIDGVWRQNAQERPGG